MINYELSKMWEKNSRSFCRSLVNANLLISAINAANELVYISMLHYFPTTYIERSEYHFMVQIEPEMLTFDHIFHTHFHSHLNFIGKQNRAVSIENCEMIY